MGDDQTSQHLRLLATLSDVVNYPEADYHLQLRAIFRVDPGERHRFNEDWYRDFYGETYYGLYFGSPQKVDMVDVKGDGAFHVALLEDLCPKYAFDLERNMVLNTNTFAVKKLLRQHSPRWFQVHATQTQQESDADYRHLFGSSGREAFRKLQLSKRQSIVEQHGLQVDQAIYVLPWRRIFIPVDAMETLGVIMQSEWYRFELDVAELHTGGAKKPSAFLSPQGLLKRGWSGVTSPLNAIKDSVYAAATPRSAAATPTSRMTLPSPTEYPSLFDVRGPSSTRSADGGDFNYSRGMSTVAEGGVGARQPQSARGSGSRSNSGSSRTGSWRTGSNSSRTGSASRPWLAQQEAGASEAADDQGEEERAYLSVYHHNLHSVLTNPKASNWGGALLDALYPTIDVDIMLAPFPGLPDISARDFQPYLRKHGTNASKYEKNHVKPVSEQLSSSNDVAKCLEVVPNMFFRPTFDFTDPTTFEEVMNMATTTSLQEEVRPTSPAFLIPLSDFDRLVTASNVLSNAPCLFAGIQLTANLDRVEFTLLRQVSSRSDRFFEASADQEVMKQSITVACDQVATLRKTMDRLRNGLADKTLDIVSLHRRQKRISELHELVTLIEEVKSAESAVEALVQCQDYTSALDLIESSQTTLRDHLQGIHGLSSLSEKFRGYRAFISTQISQRFISIITSPEWMFREEDEASHSMDPVERKRRDSLSTAKDKDCLQLEMKRLLDVLFRVDALNDTVQKYLDQLNEEIRVVVKTVVTETIAMSSSSKSSGGATTDLGGSAGSESKVSIQLRALTSDEFLQCVQMIFEHLLMVLKRAVVVQDILVKSMQKKIDEATEEEQRLKAIAGNEALESAPASEAAEGDSSDGWSPAESASDEHKTLGDWKKKTQCSKVIREIDEVVRKTCEFSQRSVSNLFAVRKEVQAVYTMPQLRKLYDTTMDFVVSIEKLTGKTDYTLRGVLFSQLKLFLEKYHHAQVTKLVSTLDHELWKNTEISETRHKSLEDLSSGRGVALLLSDDREISGETAAPRKMVAICGKSFRVVCLETNNVDDAAPQLFNSRTTQLVLGAGAMQIARLKSISARHLGDALVLLYWLASTVCRLPGADVYVLCRLVSSFSALLALASQSLELSMTLIPHIKAALAAHFTDRQKLLLDEFDRVLRDFAEHDEKIFSKFTSIVEDQIMKRFLENVAAEVRPPWVEVADALLCVPRLIGCVPCVGQVDYDSGSLSIPTNPMRGITQSTLKLHAVLHPVLSPPQMKDVMSRVFDMFTQKLPDCFKQVHPQTATGKKRWDGVSTSLASLFSHFAVVLSTCFVP
ncbi:hypothetical protein BBJ28_00011870 [Nothophytophthora sp. Chile5]|nr:hypothetical protein BBJ28_00011870 [Nothophytophthora sp. Chile5]